MVDRGRAGPSLKKYKKIQNALEKNNLTEAYRLSQELKEKEGLNLYEETFLNLLLAEIYGKRGEERKAMNALSKVTKEDKYVSYKVMPVALDNLMLYQLRAQDFAAASETYQKRIALKKAPVQSQQMQQAVKDMQLMLNGSLPVALEGTLVSKENSSELNGVWHSTLFRDGIGFDQPKGQIDKIRLACDANQVETAFSTDWQYTIPDSWGACKVFVYGEPGASFRLLQYTS